MATCDVTELTEQASCFACLTPFQLELVKTVLLCQLANPDSEDPMANCDVNALLAAASCFNCLQPFQLAAIQTQLLCEVLGNGGGGGASDQVTCGAGDPVAAPSSGCGVYNNTTDGSFWAYYSGAWHELIA